MPRARTLALAGIAAPIWFTALVIIQEVRQPDYDRIALPISALAAWPLGWLQVTNFLVTASLLCAFANGLRQGIDRSATANLGTGVMMLSALGMVIAGLFSWRMIDGVPQATPMHVVGGITFFGSTGLSLIVLSRAFARDSHWRDLSPYILTAGLFVLIMFFVMGRMVVPDDAPWHSWAGALQRVVVVVWFFCLILMAVRLRRSYRHPPLPADIHEHDPDAASGAR